MNNPQAGGVSEDSPAAKSDAAKSEVQKPDRSQAQKPKAVWRSATLGSAVEAFDHRLSAALFIEAAAPTAENRVRVAVEYCRLGILDMCADRLSRAIKKAPRMAVAHELLARLWRDWGMADVALGSAYRATQYAPTSAAAANTLGTVYAALGDLNRARAEYQRALSLEPAAAWALNNLCDAELRLGRFDEAMAHCRRALNIDPALTAAHNNLALVLAASGDLNAARQEFLAAGGEAAASYNIGIVHLAERQYASAAEAFEQAIRERPSFTAAKSRAHRVRQKLLTGHE